MKDLKSMKLICCVTFLLLALMVSPCLAGGGVQISYPDGSTAAAASVRILVDNKYEFEFTTDDIGYFLFPTNNFSTAIVSVKSPDGTEFIPVTLPSAIMASGDTALVLQQLN